MPGEPDPEDLVQRHKGQERELMHDLETACKRPLFGICRICKSPSAYISFTF